MELKSFGAILTFAAELEEKGRKFYLAALEAPAGKPLRDELEKAAALLAKNRKNLLRVRQENVTEMILEPIADLHSEDFEPEPGDPAGMTGDQLREAALALEKKAEEFYRTASQKIEALKEVSRALNQVGRKRKANQAIWAG